MYWIDLNCDVGEGVGNEAALFPHISSCSIACGGHAGDAGTMKRISEQAIAAGVRIGAHPSYPDRANFGRVSINMDPASLQASVATQISALQAVLEPLGASLHHVKAHGALYNDLAPGGPLAGAYLDVLEQFGGSMRVYAPCGSRFAEMAAARHFDVWEESFADRAYHRDGRLVSRRKDGALLTDPVAIADRVKQMVIHGQVRTVEGTDYPLQAKTCCLHGDTPNAEEILAYLVAALAEDAIFVRK